MSAETSNDDNANALAIGLIIGFFFGFLIAIFVAGSNDRYQENEYRKRLVQLNAGFYDSQTGEFHPRACSTK